MYDYISECTTYEMALETLENLFIKHKYEMYARHKLATRVQQDGEMLDQYLQALKAFGRECDFQPVSALVNRDEHIRGSFINGLASRDIRQRLLEETTMTLEDVVKTARSLEVAYINSSSFQNSNNNNSISALERTRDIRIKADNDIDDSNSLKEMAAISESSTYLCYYCGGRGGVILEETCVLPETVNVTIAIRKDIGVRCVRILRREISNKLLQLCT